jgi:hypothetical protein
VPKVGDYSYDYCNLGSKRKAKKNDIDQETENMLKESMIRSMYWKMVGYKDAKSIEKTKKLEAEVREQKKKADKWEERAEKAERLIYDYENYIYANNGVDIDFKDIVEKEKEKYLALRKKRREEKIKNKN